LWPGTFSVVQTIMAAILPEDRRHDNK